MGTWFESIVWRLSAAYTRMGAAADPALLSWPGGYFIAAAVYVYVRALGLTQAVIMRARPFPWEMLANSRETVRSASSLDHSRIPPVWTRIRRRGVRWLVSVTFRSTSTWHPLLLYERVSSWQPLHVQRSGVGSSRFRCCGRNGKRGLTTHHRRARHKNRHHHSDS
jgi:hypothetical protein